MMFYLLPWILMCAVFCIRSSTSSNAGTFVSLTCNKTVEVEAGQHLKLNCTIQIFRKDCPCDKFAWEDSNNKIICDSTTYKTVNNTCEWDNKTYVSLDIEEVSNQTYTVLILTDCGEGHSSITVKVKPHVELEGSRNPVPPPNPEQDSFLVTVIGSVFIIVLVLGILSALLATKRGKEILKCAKRGKNPEDMNASQDRLVNAGV